MAGLHRARRGVQHRQQRGRDLAYPCSTFVHALRVAIVVSGIFESLRVRARRASMCWMTPMTKLGGSTQHTSCCVCFIRFGRPAACYVCVVDEVHRMIITCEWRCLAMACACDWLDVDDCLTGASQNLCRPECGLCSARAPRAKVRGCLCQLSLHVSAPDVSPTHLACQAATSVIDI